MKRSFLILLDADSGATETLHTLSGDRCHERHLTALRSFLGDIDRQSNIRNSKPVVVYHVDEEAYEAWRRARAKKLGFLPGPIVMGQRFASASEASVYLGFKHNYNRVALLLREVEEGTESIAHEGGIEWRYEDQMPC
jgi:hypothetical protein